MVIAKLSMLLLLFFTAIGFAEGEMLGQLASPGPNPSLRYSGTNIFSAGNEGLHDEALNWYVPLSHTETAAFAATGKLGITSLQSGSPDRFYTTEVGMLYSRIWDSESKSRAGATFSVGSAADKPFHSWNETNIGSTVFYNLPTSEFSSWFFGVNYFTNRPFLNSIPLPIVAYSYSPSKSFRGIFGIPIASINWNFTEKWSLSVFTIVPWSVKTEIAYTLFGISQAYSGFDFRQQVFSQANRQNETDRLFIDGKRFYLGLRSPVSRIVFFDLSLGYVIGRSVFEGQSYFKPSGPKRYLADGWQLMWNISARF